MNPKTHLEISKSLALAIGWSEKKFRVEKGRDGLELRITLDTIFGDGVHAYSYSIQKPFDYRDWNVIGPIAARYHAFPFAFKDWWTSPLNTSVQADTPQQAIALAVIDLLTKETKNGKT